MAITKEKKKELVNQYQRHKKDTGSPEIQISILTEEVNSLTNHLAKNPKDYQGQRGLLKLVSKRRRHLNYLKNNNMDSYRRSLDQSVIQN